MFDFQPYEYPHDHRELDSQEWIKQTLDNTPYQTFETDDGETKIKENVK